MTTKLVSRLTVAFLHLEPRPGRIAHNRKLIEKAITVAADSGARWIITPELCVSGYFFRESAGTGWINPQPDSWMKRLLGVARRRQLTIFLSYPERDEKTDQFYNSVFVLGADGLLKGVHRKIDVHPGPGDDWSAPRSELWPVTVDGIKVGLLICADTQHPEKAAILKEKGAQILVCPMAWGHKYSPGDRWEKITAETGIPILVCNRTGREGEVDWTKAESVVAGDGRRLLQISLDRSAVLLFDWDMEAMSPLSTEFRAVYLDS